MSALLVSVPFIVAHVPAAFAHAALIRSDPPDLCSPRAIPRMRAGDPRCATGAVFPAAPAGVTLIFNEPVSLVGRGIRVVAPDGRTADRGRVRVAGPRVTVGLDAALTGTYLITWRVISTDTHPARGAFAFSVGRASLRPGAMPGAGASSAWDLALQALARWMHFVGYALGFGALAFQATVLRPLGLGGRETEDRVWRFVTAGVVLLLLAEPLALLAQTASLGASGVMDSEVTSAALESSFGRVLAQRFGAALLLWVLSGVVRAGSGRGALEVRAALGVAALGLALAWVDGEAAHAAGTRPVWAGLGVNTLHVAIMGAWTGGLAALLGVWPLPALDAVRGAVVARAGRMAMAALGVLLLTGSLMTAQHLAHPADFFTSPYGRTLAVKLGMVFLVLFLAGAAMRASSAGRALWWRREATALLGVLALAGLLVSLPPPR